MPWCRADRSRRRVGGCGSRSRPAADGRCLRQQSRGVRPLVHGEGPDRCCDQAAVGRGRRRQRTYRPRRPDRRSAGRRGLVSGVDASAAGRLRTAPGRSASLPGEWPRRTYPPRARRRALRSMRLVRVVASFDGQDVGTGGHGCGSRARCSWVGRRPRSANAAAAGNCGHSAAKLRPVALRHRRASGVVGRRGGPARLAVRRGLNSHRAVARLTAASRCRRRCTASAGIGGRAVDVSIAEFNGELPPVGRAARRRAGCRLTRRELHDGAFLQSWGLGGCGAARPIFGCVLAGSERPSCRTLARARQLSTDQPVRLVGVGRLSMGTACSRSLVRPRTIWLLPIERASITLPRRLSVMVSAFRFVVFIVAALRHSRGRSGQGGGHVVPSCAVSCEASPSTGTGSGNTSSSRRQTSPTPSSSQCPQLQPMPSTTIP